MTKKIQDWALDLAALGFDVGPLQPRGKAPITPNGYKDFTDNPNTIAGWWETTPNANIGVRVPAGHIVIDIDPRNGGNETWEKLRHLSTPTYAVKTGGGGWHFYYRLPYDLQVKGTLGEGVDIKANNGYVVGPGSIHPNGTPYDLPIRVEWPMALLPAGLVELVRKYPKPKPMKINRSGGGEGLIRAVAEAKPGERNSILFWAACEATRDGLDLDHELTLAAESIGLDSREISATLQSAKAVA